ncbi:MAG TPA: hypothetical protein VGV69_09440 [Solirubrobacterales bacterium]|nr:hypothetical protein [Solirubrobacterales bacterium]
MSGDTASEVKVELAEGVKGDIAELTAASGEADPARHAEVEALKRRIAELFLECEANPYVGETMGPGRHPELIECRRVRFDVEGHRGKPRFRLIYRNEPSDGAPARSLWLAVGPRSGLRAHWTAERRSRG